MFYQFHVCITAKDEDKLLYMHIYGLSKYANLLKNKIKNT